MLFLIGDSHTGAIRNGLGANAAAQERIAARFGAVEGGMVQGGHLFQRPFFEQVDGGLRFLQPQAREAFTLLTGETAIVPSDAHAYGFCLGTQPYNFLNRSFWTAYSTELDDDDRLFLTSGVLEAMVWARIAYAVAFARHLRQLGIRAFFIASPPFRRDFHTAYSGHGSLETMLTVWRLFLGAFRAGLAKHGMPLVEPPAAAHHDGLLVDALASPSDEDVVHVSPRYGALVWDDIVQRDDIMRLGTAPVGDEPAPVR